jgi:glutathione peroxidase
MLTIAALMILGQGSPPPKHYITNKPVENIYAFKMKDIDGKEVPLSKFKGKTLVVVNTASKCGLTPQYEKLEALYEKYKGKGLVVLGFPANNFGNQEPGTEGEIKQFCSANYHVTFPMFSKISVLGDDTHPLYQWLLASTDSTKPVEWNFAKFVVSPEGKVVARFAPKTAPDAPEFVQTVEKALPK